MAVLTPRMKNWLTGMGGHIATASKNGVPSVIVVETAQTKEENSVIFTLSNQQIAYIKDNVAANPKVAFGPGGIGSIRAAYQFKGKARIDGNHLIVNVDEIYCTKPGPEAGLRLDVLPLEDAIKFEESRWRDDGPPNRG